MRDSRSSRIRWLLRSGELVEIGGPTDARCCAAQPTSAPAHPSTTRLLTAFAAIYLIWGSTYLGTRYAVESIPPLWMMGVRHLTGGALLYSWTRWRGIRAPEFRDWKYPAVIGTMLFLGGHGSLAWAEQRLPSGIAALLVATLPLMIVVLARVWGTEPPLDRRAVAGLVLGFLGVLVLFGPSAWRHNRELNPLGAGAVLWGTFIWAAGTIYMRNVRMPESPLLSASMQMLAGGASLIVVAALTGEARHFRFAALTARSVGALAYLIIFGSIVAFSSYTWLHTVATPSRVATYAYVNPVVAVLVGWALAGEPVGPFTILAMLVILAGVALVNAARHDEHEEASKGMEEYPTQAAAD